MSSRDSSGKAGSCINWDLCKTILITKEKNKGLYSNQFQTACSLIDDIAASWFSERNLGEKEAEQGNTVIGVSGERGSGKTSFLYSLEEMIPDNVYSLGCVDPASFSSEMNALEIFLAQLYSRYKDIQSKMNDHEQVVYAPAIHKTLKDITRSLATLHMDKGVFASENPSIEMLENMASLQEMRGSIKKLCQEFLGVVNGSSNKASIRKNTLMILFDDVDLTKSEYIYRLLEDVRKYLSGNLIVVISYRQRQLFDSVLDSLLRENKLLLKKGAITVEQIKGRAEDFIAKVLHADRIISLLSQADLLEKEIVDVFASLDVERLAIENELIARYSNYSDLLPSNLDFCSGMTVRQWIDAALYCKTLMTLTPVNTQENVSHLWPRNLREIVVFVELIHVQMSFPDSQALWSTNSLKGMLKNLATYKNSYFVHNLEEALDSRQLLMLHRWQGASTATKNYVLYEDIFAAVYDMGLGKESPAPLAIDEYLDGTLRITEVYPENVTIGDVYDILMRYIKASVGNELKVYFGTSLKVLCSVELLTHILQMLVSYNGGEKDEPQLIESFVCYSQLVNSAIVAPTEEKDSLIEEVVIPSIGRWTKYFKSRPEHTTSQSEEDARFRANPSLYPNFQECKQVLIPFISPKVKLKSKEYRVSRPEWRIDERTRRLVPTSQKHFREHNNRFLFPKAGYPQQSRLNHGTYPLCVLNLFAYPDYVTSTIASISNNGPGGYLFYSLMDLDVFTKTTYDERQASRARFLAQMKRINSALAYSAHKAAHEDPRHLRQELKSDDAAVDISIPFEVALFPCIKSPFVADRNGRYRPFSDSERIIQRFRIPSYDDVQKVFDLLDEVNAAD